MFPLIGRLFHENDVEPVVLVATAVVVFESRQLADDPDVRQARFLLDLTP
jgi:hypothetical protein